MVRLLSSTKKTPMRVKLSILLWATIAAALCGISGFGEPLELALRAVRSKIINHQPSGQVVIVEVDDKLVSGDDSDQKSKLYHAKLIEKLTDMGAKRIILNMDASHYTGSTGDKELINALSKNSSKVIFNVPNFDDSINIKTELFKPSSEFLKNSLLSINKFHFNDLGFLSYIPYNVEIDRNNYLSTAFLLSKYKNFKSNKIFLDGGVNVKNIDIIESENLFLIDLKNKIVIVDTLSNNRKVKFPILGQGDLSNSHVNAMTIENLMIGEGFLLKWHVFFIVSFLCSIAILFCRSEIISRFFAITSFFIILIVPIYLDANLMFADTVPALALVGWSFARHSWVKFNLRKSRINPATGFANLNALRDLKIANETYLIVARAQNFAEISTILPDDKHDDLALQIVQRLVLGADGATIYQGDDGVFAWMMNDDRQTPLHDTLEGLHALFSSPLLIDENRLDLALTFGLDKTYDRSISNRLGSALLAANQAAEAHLKWKEYDAVALDSAEWKLSLVGRLDEAIDKGEIWVAYQPKLDIRTGLIIGAEALVRWSHPIRGEMGPVDFVMAAEAQNRIGKLTNFVLDQALSVASTLSVTNPDFSMAVNLSGRLLDDPAMMETINALLKQHDYPAERLTLEITESAAIESNDETRTFMKQLRKIGIKISIDDYGTGFSTLDYITSIPANEIKIDRRFVSQMQVSQSDRVVVNSTIQLAHQLNRVAVAEGVEDAETLASLGSMGCDVAQGYFISRPLTQEALSSMIANQNRAKLQKLG